MNRVHVLKDVAYAAKVGGGAIAGYDDVNLLEPGAIAFFNEQGGLVDLTASAADIADSKFFTAVVGRADDTSVVTMIPRKGVKDVNVVNYRAATKVVHTIGGITAQLSVPFTTEGEVSIKVDDVTFSSKGQFPSVRASAYKKATTTNEEFVDSLVAKLNAAEPEFIVATKVKDGTDTYFGIEITPINDDIFLDVSVTDMWESASNTITTAAVHSIGKGSDILQMEKDFSTEEGNGNYIDYTTEHYKRGFEVDASAGYDVVTVLWEGTHSSPTRSHNVMINRLAIACLESASADTPPASNQTAGEILALLDIIIGAAYDTDSGAETVDDDGTELDGVSGN